MLAPTNSRLEKNCKTGMVTLRITSERKRAWVYVENAAIKHSNLAAGREAAWLEVYLPSMQAPLNCCFIIIVTNTKVKNVFLMIRGHTYPLCTKRCIRKLSSHRTLTSNVSLVFFFCFGRVDCEVFSEKLEADVLYDRRKFMKKEKTGAGCLARQRSHRSPF